MKKILELNRVFLYTLHNEIEKKLFNLKKYRLKSSKYVKNDKKSFKKGKDFKLTFCIKDTKIYL